MSRKLNIARSKKWFALLLAGLLAALIVSPTVFAAPTAADLSDLQDEQEALEQELGELMDRISEVNAEQEKCAADLKQAEEDVSQQYSDMKERIVYMYEEGRSSFMTTLLESKSMGEFINHAYYISTISEYDRKMLDELNKATEAVKKKKEQLMKQHKELKELQEKRLEKQDELAKEIEAATAELEAAKAAYAKASDEDKAAAKAALDAAKKKAAKTSKSVSTKKVVKAAVASGAYTWNGKKLTKKAGVNKGPSGKETYYNQNMTNVVKIMRAMGNKDKYWVRSDGCKMLGDYIIVAANLKTHPRGSLVNTSLGKGIVCDTGGFAKKNKKQLDIATNW